MVNFDQQLALANVYAQALYGLADADGTVADVRSELDELDKLYHADPAFADFLSSAAIEADNRAASLDKIFRGQLSDKTLNTLQIMNKHGRSGLISALHRAFVLLEEKAKNLIECTARSACELTNAQKESVREVAAKVSGKQPLMTYEVDDTLLGGLVLEMAGWRYDNSLKRHLFDLKKRLFERGDHGLAVGAVSE